MQELRFFDSGPALLYGVEGLRQQEGQVVAEMRLGRGAAGPDGRTAVGAFGVLVDEVLGYTIMASLGPSAWAISTEIWMDVVGPLPTAGEQVSARARTSMAGSFATGEVSDTAGRTLLQCRQRGRRVPPPEDLLVAHPGDPGASRPVSREAEELLGLRAEGDVHVLRSHRGLANPRQMLHGGVSLAASEAVATRSRLASGCSLPTSSVHIVHTRGVPLDALVAFHAETRHAGRTLWVTTVIGTVEGRTCTVATVTAQE